MSLHNRPSKLRITSATKSAHVRPTTRNELRKIIEQELNRQGPDANLNHIDVSEITDMRMLFCGLNIHNIKIDEWDVSNVTNMCAMFDGCSEFNDDISEWDVSNVTDMFCMFAGCSRFEYNLSNWNTLNVKDAHYMFDTESYGHAFTSDNS